MIVALDVSEIALISVASLDRGSYFMSRNRGFFGNFSVIY